MEGVCRVFGRIKHGSLTLVLPDQSTRHFGEIVTELHATIRVNDLRFFRAVAVGSDVGFGESFVDGLWDSEDPTMVLRVLGRNQDLLNERAIGTSKMRQVFDRIVHLLRDNTLRGSQRNISYHYDLSNDFYRLMLDPTMTYSCALFQSAEESLEQGQRNKLAAMISKARIKPTHHVLEIGSGWGALAIEIARSTGAKVTTITLSVQQLETVRRRVEEGGLADKVNPVLIDYRNVEGQFDRIVSVEMLEAVGEKHLGTFFAQCDRLLKPGGLAVVQVITLPDYRYGQYRTGCDWIQKHIFPGCLVPSLSALTKAMAESSRFYVESIDNIGIHYARTLREWRERVHAHDGSVRALGFDDRFLRLWDYYLHYCEAGFEERITGTLQMVFTRPGVSALPKYEQATR
jgi:cyclopropane-fatty-acyl-phospholipid synthase